MSLLCTWANFVAKSGLPNLKNGIPRDHVVRKMACQEQSIGNFMQVKKAYNKRPLHAICEQSKCLLFLNGSRNKRDATTPSKELEVGFKFYGRKVKKHMKCAFAHQPT